MHSHSASTAGVQGRADCCSAACFRTPCKPIRRRTVRSREGVRGPATTCSVWQNPRVKTFVGAPANALKIWIWTALIAILLPRYLKPRARWGWSLSNLVALLRQQLFVHRELFAWLDEPFHPPPGSEPQPQQQLLLAGMEA